ncbi:hypothetical protein D3C77_682470 [compost metagenome]
MDRESAYEMLNARKGGVAQPEQAPAAAEESFADQAGEFLQSAAGQAIKSAVRQAANQFGRQLVRGLMGSLLGGSKRR